MIAVLGLIVFLIIVWLALLAFRRTPPKPVAFITVVIDRQGKLAAAPRVSLPGLATAAGGSDLAEETVEAVCDAYAGLARDAEPDDAAVADGARAAVRQIVKQSLGRRPAVEVHVVRL